MDYLLDHFFGFADAVVHAGDDDGEIFDVFVLAARSGVDVAERPRQGVAELPFAHLVPQQFVRLFARRSHQRQNSIADISVTISFLKIQLIN